jgi:hypothetical protein
MMETLTRFATLQCIVLWLLAVVARSEEKPLKAQMEQCEMVNKFTLTEQFRFSLILFIVNTNSNSNLNSI